MATRKAKVSRGFLKEEPLKKTEVGNEVITGISGHSTVFVTPVPPVSELTLVNETLHAKILAALNGDKEAIEERNAAEKAWDAKFKKAANYVDDLADGDTLIIEQSGFKSTKTEISKKVKPGQVIIKSVKGDYTTRGKVDVECEALNGADFYIAFASPEPLNMQIKNSQALVEPQKAMGFAISTTRKLSIEGLESRMEYNIVVVGFNTAGLGAVSQTSKVVAP